MLLMVERTLQLSRADYLSGKPFARVYRDNNKTVVRILDRGFEIASLVIDGAGIARVKHQRNSISVGEQWQLDDDHCYFTKSTAEFWHIKPRFTTP